MKFKINYHWDESNDSQDSRKKNVSQQHKACTKLMKKVLLHFLSKITSQNQSHVTGYENCQRLAQRTKLDRSAGTDHFSPLRPQPLPRASVLCGAVCSALREQRVACSVDPPVWF